MTRTLLVSALFAVALTACGKKEEAAAPATAPTPAATAPADAAKPAEATAPAATPSSDTPKAEEKK